MQITSSVKPVMYATQVKSNPFPKRLGSDGEGDPVVCGNRYNRITGQIESLVCDILSFSKYSRACLSNRSVNSRRPKVDTLDIVIDAKLAAHIYQPDSYQITRRLELLSKLLMTEDRYCRMVAAQRQEYRDTRKTPASFHQLLAWLDMMFVAVVPVRLRNGVFHKVDWRGISNQGKLVERDVSAIFLVSFDTAEDCLGRQYYRDRGSLEGKNLTHVYNWAGKVVTEEIRMFNSWLSNEVYKIALLPDGTSGGTSTLWGSGHLYGADHRTNGALQILAATAADYRFKFITRREGV